MLAAVVEHISMAGECKEFGPSKEIPRSPSGERGGTRCNNSPLHLALAGTI